MCRPAPFGLLLFGVAVTSSHGIRRQVEDYSNAAAKPAEEREGLSKVIGEIQSNLDKAREGLAKRADKDKERLHEVFESLQGKLDDIRGSPTYEKLRNLMKEMHTQIAKLHIISGQNVILLGFVLGGIAQVTGIEHLMTHRDYTCPDSGAGIHASATVQFLSYANCEVVMAEMEARARGKDGWTDPHNGGIYTVTNTSTNELRTQRATNPEKAVGGKTYTDKQVFTFESTTIETTDPTGKKGYGCIVKGCSASQGFSVMDFSTNYCDMKNLYCGKEDGCKYATKAYEEFKYGPSYGESVTTSPGAGRDFSACIVA